MYRDIMKYEPADTLKSNSRFLASDIHRIRLGFRRHWEISEGIVRSCHLCNTPVTEPLLHLVSCPTLPTVRPQTPEQEGMNDIQQPICNAKEMTRILLISFRYSCKIPPPR